MQTQTNNAGPFYVMAGEKSADECKTLEGARKRGRELADAEPLPCSFWIADAEGDHVEDIARTDGAELPELVTRFNAKHAPGSQAYKASAITEFHFMEVLNGRGAPAHWHRDAADNVERFHRQTNDGGAWFVRLPNDTFWRVPGQPDAVQSEVVRAANAAAGH